MFFTEALNHLSELNVSITINSVAAEDTITNATRPEFERERNWIGDVCARHNVLYQPRSGSIAPTYKAYAVDAEKWSETLARRALQHIARQRAALEAAPPLSVQRNYYGSQSSLAKSWT